MSANEYFEINHYTGMKISFVRQLQISHLWLKSKVKLERLLEKYAALVSFQKEWRHVSAFCEHITF